MKSHAGLSQTDRQTFESKITVFAVLMEFWY